LFENIKPERPDEKILKIISIKYSIHVLKFNK
jgi:hypothetical protein